MGLGSAAIVNLAKARDKSAQARKHLDSGRDPIEVRRAARSLAKRKTSYAVSFDQCVEQFLADHISAWKSEKHRNQWKSTLDTYASPTFGKMAVSDIDTRLVMAVLRPIWNTKTETASRLRGRIERIIDWATANNLREGNNPARWRGHLKNLLPARSSVQKVKHFPALPYKKIGALISELKNQSGVAALALEFTILTCARTGETIGATWSEIDFSSRRWTIPSDRMKAGKEHIVPLSQPALRILSALYDSRLSDIGFIFEGQKSGRNLSNMSLLAVLRRMGYQNITVHGFRSSFRDWVAESTSYPREVAEEALAHTIGNKVESAYRRGNLFEKRKRLMNDWAIYCSQPIHELPEKVVSLKSA